jgi:soluble lytic murein transglycosylase-like protein
MLLPVCAAQTGGSWLERQKASLVKQRASVDSAASAGTSFASSIEKQKQSTGKQREKTVPVSQWEWSPAAKAILEVSPVTIGCIPSGLSTYDGLIEKHASQAGLNAALLRAVIQKESRFDACAVSRAGAKGLMQLMPETAVSLGVNDPFDPEENVRGGSRFLRFLIERYGGDVSLALGAYNAGPGRVDRLGRVPEFPETQDYVKTIMGALNGASAVIE